ncbi:MAG: hypothetical protein WAV22_06485, partial [Porticoccaceae bacterium]
MTQQFVQQTGHFLSGVAIPGQNIVLLLGTDIGHETDQQTNIAGLVDPGSYSSQGRVPDTCADQHTQQQYGHTQYQP